MRKTTTAGGASGCEDRSAGVANLLFAYLQQMVSGTGKRGGEGATSATATRFLAVFV